MTLTNDKLFPLTGLSRQKNVVRAFYKHMWDHASKPLIPEILRSNFSGSLGPIPFRHDQFGGYVDLLIQALDDYTSDIFDLVKVRFVFTHPSR
jgi:hypothetical protein